MPSRPGNLYFSHLEQAPSFSTAQGLSVAIWVWHGVLKLPAKPPDVWGGLFGHSTDTRPGVMSLSWPCCCKNGPGPTGALTDAPCCEFYHYKIKSWFEGNTGIMCGTATAVCCSYSNTYKLQTVPVWVLQLQWHGAATVMSKLQHRHGYCSYSACKLQHRYGHCSYSNV